MFPVFSGGLLPPRTPWGRHAACRLGQITFAANNHKVQRMGEDGKLHTVTLRDSQDAPKKKHDANEKVGRSASKAADVKTAKQSKKVVRPLDVHCQEPSRKKRFTEARHRAAKAEALQ